MASFFPRFKAVRAILLADWDPIGIYGFCPDDEYDDCVAPIAAMLRSAPSIDDLETLLLRFEREHMGLSGDVGRAKIAAQRLIRLTAIA